MPERKRVFMLQLEKRKEPKKHLSWHFQKKSEYKVHATALQRFGGGGGGGREAVTVAVMKRIIDWDGGVMIPRFLSRLRRSNSPRRYCPPGPRRHSNRRITSQSPRPWGGRVCAHSTQPA